MKKMKVVDLFGIEYAKMNETINSEIAQLQDIGNKILDFRVMGSQLNKCAVFILYEAQ